MRTIILGPPGTGKTTTLLNLVEKALSKGVPPDRIAYLAFTKKAQMEAIERASQRFGLQERDLPYFRTIHSLCFRCLALTAEQVIQSKQYIEFGKSVNIEISGQWNIDDGVYYGTGDGDRILHMINLARVRGVSIREQHILDADDLSIQRVEYVARAFEEYKRSKNMIDYTDMLRMFIDSEYSPRFDVMFVDECQDLSHLQYQVVQKLERHTQTSYFAGDDDQAIYRFAGADVDQFINLQGQSQVLGQSYRIPRSVQSVASNILRGITYRREKSWQPRKEDGSTTLYGHFQQVEINDEEDYLILVRNAFLMKEIEEDLRQNGLVYTRKNWNSVRGSHYEAILAWERLRKGQRVYGDDVHKVYDLLKSRSGVTHGFKSLTGVTSESFLSLEELQQNHGLLTTAPWFEAFERLPKQDISYLRSVFRKGFRGNIKNPKIRISTIHSAKGGEADNVILLTDMAHRTHRDMMRSPQDEKRVQYVAVTRTKKNLHVIAPKTKRFFTLQI